MRKIFSHCFWSTSTCYVHNSVCDSVRLRVSKPKAECSMGVGWAPLFICYSPFENCSALLLALILSCLLTAYRERYTGQDKFIHKSAQFTCIDEYLHGDIKSRAERSVANISFCVHAGFVHEVPNCDRDCNSRAQTKIKVKIQINYHAFPAPLPLQRNAWKTFLVSL